MALARREEDGKITLVWRVICPREQVVDHVSQASQIEAYSLAVVGSGTTSGPLIQELREAFPSMAILVVDEKNTSYEARERYWEHHPRRGWRRIVPSTMQIPPEPVDDFAAFILAERVLGER